MRVRSQPLRRHCAAVLVGCVIAASPVSAFAAAGDDPVVRVESDSPAGKEYEVPLDDARRTGEGEDSGRGAQPEAKRFGEGLGPESDDGRPAATTSSSGQSPSATPAGDEPAATSGAASTGSGSGASSGGGSTAPEATVGGSGPSLPIVAAGFIAGFAVITGGATALLRRRAA